MSQNAESLNEIKQYFLKNIDVGLSIKHESTGLRTQRFLQHILSKRFANQDTQKLYMLVLDYVTKCELACPGTSKYFLKKFTGSTVDTILDIRTKTDLINNIKSTTLSEKARAVLLEVVELCDKNSKLRLKKTAGQSIHIEHLDSHCFKVYSLLKNTKRKQEKDVKVLVIDGYIENVSEIHHILLYFSSNCPETPLAIFCRGMSDDVLNTISVNNLRGFLNCYPMKANFELEDINTLVDIAVVCGTDVVSSLKGDLISSIKLSDIKTIKELIVSLDSIHIKNNNKLNIDIHIKNIQKKSEQTDIEDVMQLCYKRIASMTSNCIEIAIPEDINFFSLTKELDEGIRLISSVVTGGYKPNETVDFFYKKLSEYLHNTVQVSLY